MNYKFSSIRIDVTFDTRGVDTPLTVRAMFCLQIRAKILQNSFLTVLSIQA